MLGLRPWLAFLRRAFAFFFWVRFDIGGPPYRRGARHLQPRPARLRWSSTPDSGGYQMGGTATMERPGAGPPQGSGGSGDAQPSVGILLAGLLAGAGIIHLVMVPAHLGDSWLDPFAFAVVGWLQLGAASARCSAAGPGHCTWRPSSATSAWSACGSGVGRPAFPSVPTPAWWRTSAPWTVSPPRWRWRRCWSRPRWSPPRPGSASACWDRRSPRWRCWASRPPPSCRPTPPRTAATTTGPTPRTTAPRPTPRTW